MLEGRARHTILIAVLLATAVAAGLLLPFLIRRGQSGRDALMPAPASADPSESSTWQQAAQMVEEDRGEPTGRQAKVTVPPELRHYADTRRFLATQVAEWKKHRFETPQNFADLAALIRKGEMVELKPVTRDYILYGVGGSASVEPFTHYDKQSGKRIPLYAQAELDEEYKRLAESSRSLETEIAGLRGDFNSTPKSERSRRREIQSELEKKEDALKETRLERELLDDYYGQSDVRQQLFAEYETIKFLADDFAGRTYDIRDARARKQMKIRMLSFLRPAAVKVMEQLASSYNQKFNRPLPLTSLVRPDEYQYQLSKVNPNATRIDIPPHSTGLAFDVFYKYMTAEEQAYVMGELARLKDEGRIEVLRENRDHYHVFAFIDGTRPDETLIRESLGKTASTEPAEEPAPAPKTAKSKKKDDEKSARKNKKEEKGKRGRAKTRRR